MFKERKEVNLHSLEVLLSFLCNVLVPESIFIVVEVNGRSRYFWSFWNERVLDRHDREVQLLVGSLNMLFEFEFLMLFLLRLGLSSVFFQVPISRLHQFFLFLIHYFILVF